MIVHPAEEIKKVERFIGLREFYVKDHFFFHGEDGGKFPCFSRPYNRCMGDDKGLPHPKLKASTVAYLKKLFRPLLETFKEETGVHIKMT